jgi:hypothetical protein
MTLYLKITKAKRAGGMAQVECLPNKHEALHHKKIN